MTAAETFSVDPASELHGYELFQGERWWKGVPPRARIAVYGKALDSIAEHSTALVLRGVHSAGLPLRYAYPDPPHTVVLSHLLERVHEFVAQQKEQVLVIADEVGEQARHRADLDIYRRKGTPGYRGKKLTTIVDTLHFAPSHASRLLQAVDLVTFLYRRVYDHTEANERSARANAALWSKLESKIVHEGCFLP